VGTKINMANHARYGDMIVHPDHTPRKITKSHMIKKRALSLNKRFLKKLNQVRFFSTMNVLYLPILKVWTFKLPNRKITDIWDFF
jgi:hypothetical protein